MVRLYLDHPLGEGECVALTRDQAHYLFGVMRLAEGAALRVFDGVSGEYAAHVASAGKRGGALAVGPRTRPPLSPPDLWLCFAPIKKARTDFIVEKAAELGAARICPVHTDFTQSQRVNRARLQAHAIEAVEQCGGTVLPEVAELTRLDRLLDIWPEARRLMFCDEDLAERGGPAPGLEGGPGPWAILIGPEGGFSDTERTRLRAMPQAAPVRLGPRILRADTAAVAAMTLWQSQFGDWSCPS